MESSKTSSVSFRSDEGEMNYGPQMNPTVKPQQPANRDLAAKLEAAENSQQAMNSSVPTHQEPKFVPETAIVVAPKRSVEELINKAVDSNPISKVVDAVIPFKKSPAAAIAIGASIGALIGIIGGPPGIILGAMIGMAIFGNARVNIHDSIHNAASERRFDENKLDEVVNFLSGKYPTQLKDLKEEYFGSKNDLAVKLLVLKKMEEISGKKVELSSLYKTPKPKTKESHLSSAHLAAGSPEGIAPPPENLNMNASAATAAAGGGSAATIEKIAQSNTHPTIANSTRYETTNKEIEKALSGFDSKSKFTGFQIFEHNNKLGAQKDVVGIKGQTGKLFSYSGNITGKGPLSNFGKVASLNAANESLGTRGMTGTAGALNRLVSDNTHAQLTGFASKWLNNFNHKTDMAFSGADDQKPGDIDAILHVAGPRPNDNSLEADQKLIYGQYIRAFMKARDEKIDAVQIPLLSVGVFADKVSQNKKGDWKQKVLDAAVQASEYALKQGWVKAIGIVDVKEAPISISATTAVTAAENSYSKPAG